MRIKQSYQPAMLAFAVIFLCGVASIAQAGDVAARLSSREAYVGMPITLQVSIDNVSDYEQPSLPQIDGCDIRSAGAPAQSSQITIINGRRSESRSVTLQYLITPRREGKFELPPLTIHADGRKMTTQSQRFVATKSVTGDLLFAEIAGGKKKVFVGEPLELTLKLWIKPFQDAERNITLSEGDMWNMISEQTAWGGFADRLRELAENNQRPGGQKILRDDGQGHERSYYLYEITATVYPKRAGKIDADDAQIVVNYPTALGAAQSSFRGMLGGSPFGGNSLMSRMMNDDFFASPFEDGLVVTSSRPIVADVSVDATEVAPVPQTGRPADYRGAVGRYQIVTRATPTSVEAGDPITLDIGIVGSGPMELVQAPPLNELPNLTTNFHVADQSLAGFVKDETKVFSTTVRPRKAGITEIPAIPFSFFDPETESFQTVHSEPIAIQVSESETLAMDAIVGDGRGRRLHDSDLQGNPAADLPDFTNNHAASILISQSPPSSIAWWWALILIPPGVCLAIFFMSNQREITDRLHRFRSPRKRSLSAIETAASDVAIADALTQYIAQATRTPCRTTSTALGQLRLRGMYELANELDAYFQELQRPFVTEDAAQLRLSHRQRATDLIEKLEASFRSQAKSPVLRSQRQKPNTATRVLPSTSPLIIAIALFAASANTGFTAEKTPQAEKTAADVKLSLQQQATILSEAGADYTKARDLAATDSATAKQLFETAAGRYQLLVDAGIGNSQLYLNLGNAYFQCGELGQAIANYERGRELDPANQQLLANLRFASSKVKGSAMNDDDAKFSGASISLGWLMHHVKSANDVVVEAVGLSTVVCSLVLASLAFWSLWIVRSAGVHFRVWRFAAAPLLIFLVSLGSYCLASTGLTSAGDAVIVADQLQLHAGDGNQFAEVAAIDNAQGQRVATLAQRGKWSQVRTAHGQIGWALSKDIEPIRQQHAGL
ncbi:BatD family protein [Blastopirellula marina]|uniref:Probable BatD n=1 Tax=Blastopirellula marina DSM 3645 TaxID=314230 RepID=A3ZYA8_9BACT|nr:BatD family protein [Blastopirellula marina]EAQ78584.1 probable BatD [Blastopirellula marina DSM 3645]